jgi:hypothetical protein
VVGVIRLGTLTKSAYGSVLIFVAFIGSLAADGRLAITQSGGGYHEAGRPPEGLTGTESQESAEPANPDRIVVCEGFEVRKMLDEGMRRTRFVLTSPTGAVLTLWEADWKAEDYFDEQMRRVYNRREDHFRAFCANVIGAKKSANELVVSYTDARETTCCWTLDIYDLESGGGRLSQTSLRNTRPPEVEDLNKDGVSEILVGDYRAYSIRELPREYAPHLTLALCVNPKGEVSDCTERYPAIARRDIARLKKELEETSATQVTATPKRRGIAIGIVASYARLKNAREGLTEVAKLCPERDCKDWVQRKTPEVLELLSGPAKY